MEQKLERIFELVWDNTETLATIHSQGETVLNRIDILEIQ